MEALKLLPWCVSAAVPFSYISKVVPIATQQEDGVSTVSKTCPTTSEPEPYCSPVPGPSRGLTPPPGTFPLLVSSLLDTPLSGTPLVGQPFSDFLAIPSQGKHDHSPSALLDHNCTKMTCVSSSKVEVGSEQSCTWDNDHMPNLTPETGTGSVQQRQESSSPSSSSMRTLANPDYKATTGSSKCTTDWTSSESGSSKRDMADSDLDTASGDCLSCLDTDDISVWTAQRKYRKRVRASYKLSKGRDWTEV